MGIPFPDIDPVAFAIGPLQIRWYALAYLAGFLLGWRYCLHLAGRVFTGKPDRNDIDDLLTWIIVGVILGGRLGYVLFYQLETYLQNPVEIFMVWHGGMSFHGGTLGVIAVLLLFAYKRSLPILRLSDIFVCAVPIGLFFGRLANFINGELFGRVTTAPWGVVFPMGGDLPRHPSQLYEAFFEGLVLFVLLALLTRSKRVRASSGFLSGVFLAGYGVFRFGIEFFREPDFDIGFVTLPGVALTLGQILSAPMILGGIVLIVYALRSARTKPEKS